MHNPQIVNLSRRKFLKTGLATGAGLTLGVGLPGFAENGAAGPGRAGDGIVGRSAFEPNAFVRIDSDNTVTVIVKHLEMGQGTYTGIPTLVAEELDAAWTQIRVAGAPANAKLYNNLFWGGAQGTGGSTAIANSFEQMRRAGAAAREMLVRAAAKKWQVADDEITVRDGTLQHLPSNRRASFGELAEAAAQEPVPDTVFLKEPSEFRLIGRALPRKDSLEKTNGKAIYTQDVRLAGMLTALVAHPPRFGGKVKSFDDSATRAIRGVTDVVAVPSGVAVLATDFWSASKGRDALKVEWDETGAFKQSSTQIMDEYRRLAQTPGTSARNDGDPAGAMAQAHTRIKAAYEFPYLAHAAMEPMNCVVDFDGRRCKIYNGEQLQTPDKFAVAAALAIPPEQVEIEMLYAGGSFGRRANPHSDYVLEAANIAKAMTKKAPVKLVWTREDDTRGGYYRPMYYHELQAGLDKDGNITAWQHRIVGQSIMRGTPFEAALLKDGIDHTSVEGAANLPYAIPNIVVDLHSPDVGVPVQWWRSVGSTHTAYSTETFIDQLAAQARQDPVELRRRLLKDQPRHLGVLELAAEKSAWGTPLAKGRGRGFAVHKSFNSYVAEVAEVTVRDDNSYSVDRVICAVDCGIAINPDVIRAQMEGGIGFGLSAVLSSAITLKDGRVEQSNFHDYTVLRMNEMPQIEVYIVPSGEMPTGVGEPGTPVIAPAVANAIASVTGKRYVNLPLTQA